MRRLRPIKGRDLPKACLSISWYSRNEDPLHPRQLTYSHGILATWGPDQAAFYLLHKECGGGNRLKQHLL